VPATYSGTGSTSTAGVWTAIVTVDGSDVSSRVVGEIRIDAEESSARTAEFTIRPAAGTSFAVANWVGKSVTIDIADNASGSPANVQRLFTGLIDTPTLNLVHSTIAILCTDDLQGKIDAMSNSAIDAAIPSSYYSNVIFNSAETGWRRAQDRLSTLASALDLDPSGSLRLTAWAAKVTPDLSFTNAHILDESPGLALASRTALINSIEIDFGYRFPRVKAEGYPITYSYVTSSTIAAHVAAGNWFLLRSSVEAAIKAAGGTIQSISYDALPNTTIGTFTPGPYDSLSCMGFTAVVSFDYAQQIEEQYTITVSAPNSIAAVGTLPDKLQGALEGVYPQVVAAENSMTLYRNDVSGIPPMDLATPTSGYTTAADVTLTADTNRTAAQNAMQTLIQVAKTRIAGSHRHNYVTASVPLNPSLDLPLTVDINVPGLHAVGKVRTVAHVLSPETGQAVTQFSLAISSVAGVGVTHSDTPNTAPAGTSPGSTELTGSPTAVFSYGPSDDHTITVTFPGVASAERNKANIALSSSYNAGLPENILTITL